jgi:hypothetical protein
LPSLRPRPRRRLPPLARSLAWTLIGAVATLALWRPRHAAPSLPPAALAPTARPPSTPPAPPPGPPLEKAELDELLGDVWIHPLPGPTRRMPIRDSRLFGAERLGDRPSECIGGHCGVDIGGSYGEPVLAVHDGVIDRVQRAANEDRGGHYVRIAHRDHSIYSQYFHLSAIPRGLRPGVQVKAGDVIGWVGTSGVKRSGPHLHFTIAIQDPSARGPRYVDPEPLIALWPLRLSRGDNGTPRLSAAVPVGLARGFSHRYRHGRVHHHGAALAASERAFEGD